MKTLTVSEAIQLAKSHHEFKWQAPIYKGNKGHLGYGIAGGKARILGVYENIVTNIGYSEFILKVAIFEGDNLNAAIAGGKYVHPDEDQVFHYSDSDRYVSFEVISNEN